MIDMTENKTGRTVWGKYVLPMAGGGLMGGLGAFFGMRLVDAGVLGPLDGSAIAALGVGMIYVFTAVMVAIGAISPRFGSHFLNVEDGDELRDMKQNLAGSAVAMLVFGLIIGLLALASDGGVMGATDTLIAVAVLGAIGLAAGIRSHRYSDELMREVGREAGSLSYYLSFLVIGGWAALAHLKVVPAPEMLDLLTMFWSIVLIASFWVCGARGMLTRR